MTATARAPQPGARAIAAGPPAHRPAEPARWDLLLVCVGVYVACAVGRVHLLFPALQPLQPAFISGVLATGLYALAQSGPRRVELLRHRVTYLLLAFTVWMALSVPGALNRGAAFHFWTGNFIKSVVMYVVIAGCIRGFRDVERLALAYFASTVVYTVVVLARFQLDESNWRLAGLYTYDANDFATLVVTAMPLGLYLVLRSRSLLWRATSLGALGTLAVGLVWSGSRGGFLALLVTICFVLFRFTTVPAKWRLAVFAVILVLVAGIASDQYWTAMQTILKPSEDYNETSETGRIKTWERGLGYMAQHPLLGVGADNFWFAEGTISPLAWRQQYGRAVRWGAAHNSFVQVGAELGVPGLLLFVAILASTFASLRRVAKYAIETAPGVHGPPRLAQSLMAALIGFSVGAFFLSLAYAEMLYTLIALAVALEKISRPKASPLPLPASRAVVGGGSHPLRHTA